MFEAVREFIETVEEFIESSFKTLEWEKRLIFDTSEYFFTGRSILISGPKFVTELFFF